MRDVWFAFVIVVAVALGLVLFADDLQRLLERLRRDAELERLWADDADEVFAETLAEVRSLPEVRL